MASVAGPSRKMPYDEMENITSLPGTSFSLLSSEVYEPTSTLQYVNSQLVAHGFAGSPGLSFDGLANDDSERIVKCLLAMLSQRMEDLGRTEELSFKLRTISYEHERLQSIYRTAVDTGANAEREMNLFKSKMAASQRALTSEVSAHKQTLSELQRTRTSLQYLRSTTQNELKRKNKEVERVLDRWNKVSDAQIKIASAHSGLRCANFAVEGAEYGKGKGLMEDALEQAEEARKELMQENEGFRSVILSAANALQGMVYNVKGLGSDVHIEEPTPLSHTAIFAPPTSFLPHPDNAHVKLRELMTAFREAFSISISISSPRNKVTENEEGVTKLKDLVKSLRDELTQARKSSNTLATRAQEALDKFTTHASERLLAGRDPTSNEAAEMSMELIGVLERDELRETLDRRAKELKMERERFTEATVKLGREKAAIEMERLKLLEEKRKWAVNQMLVELPPTPEPDPDLVSPPRPSKQTTKQLFSSPPRVRPRKVGGSKGISKSPSKKTAVVNRTPGDITSVKLDSLSPKRQSVRVKNVIQKETIDVLYEPEVRQVEPTDATEQGLQRSTTPEESPPTAPPAATVAAEMKTSLPLVLPTTFRLPPPSPASSLAAFDLGSIPPKPSESQASPLSTVPSFDAIPLAPSTRPPAILLARSHIFPSPRTPRPLANTHLKHAYSPARPSPLSRILMIADSPPSPPPAPPIEERNEEIGVAPLGSHINIVTGALSKRLLVQKVKLETPIDELSPLRERTGAGFNRSLCAGTGVASISGESESTSHNEKRFTAKEKGKGRAVPAINGVAVIEKENASILTKVTRAGKPSRGPGGTAQASAGAAGVTVVRANDARRVPIGNANVGKLRVRKV